MHLADRFPREFPDQNISNPLQLGWIESIEAILLNKNILVDYTNATQQIGIVAKP